MREVLLLGPMERRASELAYEVRGDPEADKCLLGDHGLGGWGNDTCKKLRKGISRPGIISPSNKGGNKKQET